MRLLIESERRRELYFIPPAMLLKQKSGNLGDINREFLEKKYFKRWFRYDNDGIRKAFFVGDCWFNSGIIEFTNGRHRSLTLALAGYQVPVGFDSSPNNLRTAFLEYDFPDYPVE